MISLRRRPSLSCRQWLIDDPPDLHLDGLVPFRLGWDIAVPRAGGVYLISDLRGPLYIGRTGDLRRRYGQHYLGSHNDLVNKALDHPLGEPSFAWAEIPTPDQPAVERRLIGALAPICNLTNQRPHR
jgi:hypothetical protein